MFAFCSFLLNFFPLLYVVFIVWHIYVIESPHRSDKDIDKQVQDFESRISEFKQKYLGRVVKKKRNVQSYHCSELTF